MAEEPIGTGTLCSGGQWVIRAGLDCPVCGAGPDGGCLRDPDLVDVEEEARKWAASSARAVLRAAATWREAERRADQARSHAADVHQGIEPGNIKAAHRAAQDAEREARVARDGYDAAVRRMEAGYA